MNVDLVPRLAFGIMLWICSAAVAGFIVLSLFGAGAALITVAILTPVIVAGTVLFFRYVRLPGL